MTGPTIGATTGPTTDADGPVRAPRPADELAGPPALDPAQLSELAVQHFVDWARCVLSRARPVGLHYAVGRVLRQLACTLDAVSVSLLAYDRPADEFELMVSGIHPVRGEVSGDDRVGVTLDLTPLAWLRGQLAGDGFVGCTTEIPASAERDVLDAAGVTASAFVPVTVHGELAGMLVASKHEPTAWPAHTRWLLQLVAATCAEFVVAPDRDARLAESLVATIGRHPGILTLVYDPASFEGVYTAPSAAARLGLDPATFRRDARCLLELVHPDDHAATVRAAEAIAARAQRYQYAPELAEPVELRIRAVDPNGALLFLELRLSLVRGADGPLVALVIRVRPEYDTSIAVAPGAPGTPGAPDEVLTGFLPSFVESSDTIVALYDPGRDEGLYISAAYERITGRSARAWCHGEDRLSTTVLGPGRLDETDGVDGATVRERLSAQLAEVAAGQRPATAPFHQGEYRLLAADWTERVFTVSLFGVQHDGRWVVGLLATDVTEERQLQAERDAALAAATEALATRDRFIGRLSYATLGPMHSLMGWIELARAGATPDAQLRLQRAKHDGTRLVALLGDALELGRLQTEPAPDRHPVALGGVVEEVLGRLAPVADAARVDIAVAHVELVAVGPVLATAGRLVQILEALVANAVKFSPPHGTVELSAHAAGPLCTLAVRDHGPGVDPELAERLFEPFERGEGLPGVGVGLGLSVAAALATSLGATLALDPTVTDGARFTLTLDRAPDRTVELARGVGEPGRRTHAHVLCVEDDPGSRELLRELLADDPRLSVEVVGSVAEARAAAATRPPDLVLTDLYLPDAQGVEVLEQLHGAPGLATVPVVVMSADRRQQVVRSVTAAGATAFWGKPLPFAELAGALAGLAGLDATG